MLYLAGRQYSIKNHALEIFTAGCRGENGVHCKGCFNPALWEFKGKPFEEKEKKEISCLLIRNAEHISSIRIYGGEPLENTEEDLRDLLDFLNIEGLEHWIFTRFEFEAVPAFVKDWADYIKCGPYREDLSDKVTYYGVELASSNQKIYKKEGESWV